MGKWIIVLSITFSSCISSKNISNFSINDKRVTFEKVKIKINSKALGNVTLKGYINLIQDSLLCFKFYGPFSYEVVSGVYLDTFKVFDHFNNVIYRNLDDNIFAQTGVIINRKVLEYLLLGRISEMKAELLRLSNGVYRIDSNISSKKCEVLIFNNAEQKHFKLKFLLENQTPKSILISYNDSFTNWNAIIQNVTITNRSKKCNFGF